MLTHCVRNLLSTHASILNMRHCSKTLALQHARGLCRASASQDLEKESLLQLFVDRYYISPGQTNMQLFQRGRSCRYGPLGTELRRNVLDQWWHSVSRSGAQVFGISSVNCIQDGEQYGCGQLRITDSENFAQTLEQKDLSNEQLIQKMRMLLQRAPSVRTDFLQGALEQFVPSLKLVNRKLPFGLAETGLCFQASDGSARLRSPRRLSCGSALLILRPSGWITGLE